MHLFLSTELRESPGWGRLGICSAELYNASQPPAGEGPAWAPTQSRSWTDAGVTEPLEVAPPWADWPSLKSLTSFTELFVSLLILPGIPSINSFSLSQRRGLQQFLVQISHAQVFCAGPKYSAATLELVRLSPGNFWYLSPGDFLYLACFRKDYLRISTLFLIIFLIR